jgi:hypothetical protein
MITNLTTADLSRRIARLEKLGRDLADEAAVFEDGNDPLRHEERRSYVSAILDAVELDTPPGTAGHSARLARGARSPATLGSTRPAGR